jgi:hypothetical protein
MHPAVGQGIKYSCLKAQSKTTAGAKAIRVKDGKGCTAGERGYTPYYWVNKGKKELDYGKKDGWGTGIVGE